MPARDAGGRFVKGAGAAAAGSTGPVSGSITLNELAGHLAHLGPALFDAIERGAHSGAQAGRVILIGATPTNTGQLRNAWKVSSRAKAMGGELGALAAYVNAATPTQVYNEAPHAGIVERGARPHAVNRAGIEALTLWARRKLGLDEKAAKGVAFAIAHKLRTQGQKPTFFVRNQIPLITKVTQHEVERELKKLAGKAGK